MEWHAKAEAAYLQVLGIVSTAGERITWGAVTACLSVLCVYCVCVSYLYACLSVLSVSLVCLCTLSVCFICVPVCLSCLCVLSMCLACMLCLCALSVCLVCVPCDGSLAQLYTDS